MVLLLTASGSFAQTPTRYIDPVAGKSSGNCTSADAENANGPCTLARAYTVDDHGDLFLIQIVREGDTATIDTPSAALDKRVKFGVYAKGTTVATKGSLVFIREREFKIAAAGQFQLHDDASVEFAKVTVEAGNRGSHQIFLTENDSEKRIAITGTLKLNQDTTLDHLVVSKSFTVEYVNTGTLDINKSLIVNRGATLTLKTNLYFFVKKKTSDDPKTGVFIVNGAIETLVSGTQNPVIFAYVRSNRGDGSQFIPSAMYKPDAKGAIDDEDCLRIQGSGTIGSIWAVAVGNICVELKEVQQIQVGGSIQEGNDGREAKHITTDIIFRNDVVINGDLIQWNDSRIVFEKTATIKGHVILRDGVVGGRLSSVLGWVGPARASSDQVRRGIRKKSATAGEYSCAYTNEKTHDGRGRGVHIPGVQFEDAVTIEGELQVRSNSITEMTSHATDSTMTMCAPRVLFMVPRAKTTGSKLIAKTSRVGRDLVIEGDVSFAPKGRVYLDYDSLTTTKVKRETTHSLHVGGDISASGTAIGIKHSKTFSNAGMCGATKATPGSEIVLTGTGRHVVSGTLTLGALQTYGDLDVQNGTLTVKHLHVRPGGELKSDGDVKLDGGALILHGDGLQGTLADGSVITHLVYGSGDTDTVKPGGTLEALTILAGTGEVRLDEVTKTKNLGLCSGTLVLREAGTDKDSTLSVHDQITVQNGFMTKDTNRPGSIATDTNRYLLKYITPGKRTVTDALEWFDPQDVEVAHKSADISVEDARSLMGKLTVTNGKLTVDGDLTVGASSLHRTGSAALTNVGNYSVVLGSSSTSGELHTKEDDVVVHGQVTLHGMSKLMTGGGDVHVLGRVKSGNYPDSTAQVTVAAKSMVMLGSGTLMLGPEDTAKRNGLTNTSRPDVVLTLHGTLEGEVSVPKGSKVTKIDAATDSKMLGTVTFDGMQTPKASGDDNWDGTLKFMVAAEKTLTIDSLSAMNGSVETHNKAVTITKDVHLSSATIWSYSETTTFMGDLKVSGTGGLNTEHNADDAKRSIMIHGDYMQTKGTVKGDLAGVKLHPKTTKTVKGDFMVSADASRYVTEKTPTLIIEGDFEYMQEKLTAKVEFKGKEVQEVETGMKTELDSVVVNNAKGLRLASSVMQGETAGLTLRRGRIMNADTTATAEARTWTIKNPQIEENLKDRTSALEAKKCGADEDEACKFSISRGSLQSHASVSFARHLEHGNSGDGALSGGYLFPVGNTEGKQVYYRPLMLQLPFDLTDAKATTVSVMTDSEMRLADPLTVPGPSGGSLTLDVHADVFWKIETGEEALESEVSVRVVAAGLRNVSDVKGLRIVQWDCEWKNPKLAGRYSATIAAGSFGVNDLLNGVVNVTQERVNLEACTILGIAANGVENPIDQAELTGGRARLQFIHNLPLPAPVNLDLGDVRISSSLQFRDATAYRVVGAGSNYVLTIQPDGAPAEQAIKVPLPTLRDGRSYVAIAHGSVADPKALFMETRLSSSVTNKVEAILVHGSADLGAVDVRVLDASDNLTPLMTLADNIPLNGKTSYRALDASMHNVQVSSPTNEEEYEVFRMDLGGYRNETVVLNLSGSKDDLRILGVDKDGTTFLPDVITGVETERAELPTEFVLHGNYPNPFNPSTRIQFDLPETAQVRVQIVDMLGREVMSLPAQEFEAGANWSMEIHAMNLASGTYLYRMIATGAESRHVKTGRMTLVK